MVEELSGRISEQQARSPSVNNNLWEPVVDLECETNVAKRVWIVCKRVASNSSMIVWLKMYV
jgi:hypothetical protein